MSNEIETRLSLVTATDGITGPGASAEAFYEGVRNGLVVRVVKVHEWVCGYVKLPEGHPWRDAEMAWDIETSVHGGITYSDSGWVGFDTNHGWDVWPDLITSQIPEWKLDGNLHEWTAAEFMAELELLAKEAADADTPKELEAGE